LNEKVYTKGGGEKGFPYGERGWGRRKARDPQKKVDWENPTVTYH